ncbi:MAG: hypothetical protein MI864_25675 [Pseudomonadales bacterium]|nr:hypothetical protein [Pseudomonadales bacterium]
MASASSGRVNAQEPITYDYIYPAPEIEQDERFVYLLKLIRRSLDVTRDEYGRYTLSPALQAMSESRYLSEVKQGNVVNLVWSSTSRKKERQLRAIKIPVYRGLLSYRVCLVNKNRLKVVQERLSQGDLSHMLVGQGIGWGDVTIYRHNNIHVQELSYGKLFELLHAARFDLLPRGISEVFPELAMAQAKELEIALEPSVYLYYPWPYYLFTNRTNNHLADRLETGLLKLIESGEFHNLWESTYRDYINRAQLDQRKRIELHNPLLDMASSFQHSKFWYTPGEEALNQN